jgi:hypothetical protein
MPQISRKEFERVPLRAHDFLTGVPLQDAWTVDLPRFRPGITLHDFLQNESIRKSKPSPVVRALFKIRFAIGRVLGWDREADETAWESFSKCLTPADREKSLVPAGTKEKGFRVVYHFDNEQLLELANRTTHGAVLSALVETCNAYHFYFAVYVRKINRFTPVYMALITPFRKLIVYPSLLRSVRASWDQTFA